MFLDYSKLFQEAGSMSASYQGSEILNEFPLKIAQFLRLFLYKLLLRDIIF